MSSENLEDEQPHDTKEFKNLATNTFYSFLINYGSHFFTLITSFLLARVFTDDTIWGFLIIATSYITIVVIITSFFPPGQNYALNYYIPRYLALNEKSKIKFLIRNALTAKILFLIPLFIISLILFNVLANIFSINLQDKVYLLYILSPLIIFNSLQFSLNAINRGFSRFNIIFIFLVLRELIYTIPLIIYLILKITNIVEMVAFFRVISTALPFFLNFAQILLLYRKIKPSEDEKQSFKKDFRKTFKYGSYLGYSDIINRSWKETQYQGISIIVSKQLVLGYNIAWNYKDIAAYSVLSFTSPMLTSFSSLVSKENYKQVRIIYLTIIKITLFLLLIIAGTLFFSTDFALDFIFLETRLYYSDILRLLLLASILKFMDDYVETLLSSQKKVKLSLLLKILYMTFNIPLFFIGLIFFGINGAIIGLIIANAFSLIIQIFVTYKVGNIKLNIKKIIIQYSTFFIPLGITLILEKLIFKNLSFTILEGLGLSLFKNLDFLSIGTFLILFITMNLVFKTVSSSDIQYVETFFDKDSPSGKITLKGLNVLKKFTRK